MILGEEPVLPYQRPPLSKKYVSGELAFERLLIRAESWYLAERIDLRRDTRVVAVSPPERTVTLADGASFGDAGAYEHPEALLFRNGFE